MKREAQVDLAHAAGAERGRDLERPQTGALGKGHGLARSYTRSTGALKRGLNQSSLSDEVANELAAPGSQAEVQRARARALTSGPQVVTRHGRAAVVVVSAEDYGRLRGGAGFKEFLRTAPDLSRLGIRRDRRPGRRVTL